MYTCHALLHRLHKQELELTAKKSRELKASPAEPFDIKEVFDQGRAREWIKKAEQRETFCSDLQELPKFQHGGNACETKKEECVGKNNRDSIRPTVRRRGADWKVAMKKAKHRQNHRGELLESKTERSKEKRRGG